MKITARHLIASTSLFGFLFLGACTTHDQTEQIVQARMDAEKVKMLTSENTELKAMNGALRQENEALKLDLAKAVAVAKAQPSKPMVKTAPVVKPTKASAAAGEPSPAEVVALKKQVTGGGSFK